MTVISAPTPDSVKLIRDENGVPHIIADDVIGGVWGMGYCHALDRGLQMGLMRVLGKGRLCECFEDSDASLAIDVFFRRMNWAGQMKEQVAALDDDAKAQIQSYCDGVNARFSQTRPWEFRLLGYKPELWTTEDCLLLARMTGYLTLAQSQAEIERLFIELAQGGVDDDKLVHLFQGCFEKSAFEHVSKEILDQVNIEDRLVPSDLKWLAAPRAMASNNWVVSAKKSKTGTALLSNDPHLEVNRLPNVWVEQVIELPKDTFYCANMPGLPAPLVGRNESLSWGATYTFMDAVDSWVEHCKEGSFRQGDDDENAEWVKFSKRKEVILRKKNAAHEVTFFENKHGTLEGNPATAGYYLCTRWAPSDSGAQSLNAITQMWNAKTVDEGMAALGLLETSWNWVFADTHGDIGYQMSGRFPLRKAGWNGFSPAPGWDKTYDWQGYAAVEDLPRVKNPDEGYVVTANNDLNALGKCSPINMPMGDYRERRIAERLEALFENDACDLSAFRDLHMDVFSRQAEQMMAILRPVLPDTKLGNLLRDWDLRYDVNSLGATLFELFYAELLLQFFAENGFGEGPLKHLQKTSGVFIDFYANFDALLLGQESSWLQSRDLSDVYRAAFARVDDENSKKPLQSWGDKNQILLTHILFDAKLPRFLGFDYGPIPLPGGRATPHQGQVYKAGDRQTSFAPSLRILADMGENTLHTSLVGGPSDRRFSKWYTSEVKRWQRGETKKLSRLS